MLRLINSSLIVLLCAGLLAGCATPTPVAVTDPAAVVQGFWDAVKELDLDAAMTFIADDVQCRGGCYLNGKEALRSFLDGRLNSGTIYEINDLQVEGDTVNYSYSKSKAGFLEASGVKETMRVQNGKIIYWEAN